MGYATLVGLAAMVGLMLPLNLVLARKIRAAQQVLMKAKDERIKVSSEVLSTMKIIKLYGWESSFGEKIRNLRNEELRKLRTYTILDLIDWICWFTLPTVVTLLTFATFVLAGNELTPSRAFTSLALFNLLRFPLNVFPSMVISVIEAQVSTICSWLMFTHVFYA